jgi:hypothetical protein
MRRLLFFSAAQYAHRQDYVRVFAALKKVAQDIVGDAQMNETILLWVA